MSYLLVLCFAFGFARLFLGLIEGFAPDNERAEIRKYKKITQIVFFVLFFVLLGITFL